MQVPTADTYPLCPSQKIYMYKKYIMHNRHVVSESLLLSLVIMYNYWHIYIYVMVWSGRRTGHRQRSQSKSETTAGGGDSQVLLYSSRQFSALPKSSLASIDKRTARAARGNTRYRYNWSNRPAGPQNGWQLRFLGPHKYSFLYNN